MQKAKRIIHYACLAIALICFVIITIMNIYTQKTGKGNASISIYSSRIKEKAEAIAGEYDDPLAKAESLMMYIIENFEYDETLPVGEDNYRLGGLDQTLDTRMGVCHDFSTLYAAFCRSQGIECYCVTGKKDGSEVNHMWNRLHIDGKWYNVNLTSDILKYKDNERIIGMEQIESKDCPYLDYKILTIQ